MNKKFIYASLIFFILILALMGAIWVRRVIISQPIISNEVAVTIPEGFNLKQIENRLVEIK